MSLEEFLGIIPKIQKVEQKKDEPKKIESKTEVDSLTELLLKDISIPENNEISEQPKIVPQSIASIDVPLQSISTPNNDSTDNKIVEQTENEIEKLASSIIQGNEQKPKHQKMNPYPHRYKYGKQTDVPSIPDMIKKIESANLPLHAYCYVWLSIATMARKSELYSLTAEKVQVFPDHVLVDIQRLKKSRQTPPIFLYMDFPGVKELCILRERALKKHPKIKTLYQYSVKAKRDKDGDAIKLPNGKYNVEYKCIKTKVSAHWIWPHITKSSAIYWVKKALGDNTYPHFCRMIGVSNALRTTSVQHVRSMTGMSLRNIEFYASLSRNDILEVAQHNLEDIKKAKEVLAKNKTSETTNIST